MKKILLVIILLPGIRTALAQNDNTSQRDDPAKYALLITAADLQKHLTILASDEMEGR